MMAKGKGWPVIGQIVENTDKKGNKFRSVKIADNVTILVDGEEINMNQYRSGNLVSPVDEVEQLIERGVISEDKQEFRREKAQEVSSWLKYNIVVPPPKNG
jgi:predicted transcriptional regulator